MGPCDHTYDYAPFDMDYNICYYLLVVIKSDIRHLWLYYDLWAITVAYAGIFNGGGGLKN